MKTTTLGELKVGVKLQLALSAATEPRLAFDALADLMEEVGVGPEACAAVRELPQAAAGVAGRMGAVRASGLEVGWLRLAPEGVWAICLGDPIPPTHRGPVVWRGRHPAFGVAVEHFDDCFAGLDALGVMLGFRVIESSRTPSGDVLSVTYRMQ